MKKHIPFLIVLAMIAIGIISSCKKDPSPTDGIVFGQTNGMIVTTYDSIMEYYDASRPLVLDLNGDGANDIKIETFYDGPIAIGDYQTLTLYCLNKNIEVHGDSIVSETYSHRDTIISVHDGWTEYLYCYTFSSCGKVDGNDGVGITDVFVFELMANEANDHLSLNDHFQSAEVKLFRENKQYGWVHEINEEEQYLTCTNDKFIYDCWNFPTDDEKYIGFKLTINGEPRLGWLKIKLCPIWDGKVVNTQLIETAIQQ